MNPSQIAAQYRQTSAQGMHPVGLVVQLYDSILEDFRRALAALREAQVEPRVAALNHALLVIAELEGVLDHQRGGEVARHLQGFYRVARAMILEENLRARPEGLERLVALFLPVRQAWQQAEQELLRTVVGRSARVQALSSSFGGKSDGEHRCRWSG